MENQPESTGKVPVWPLHIDARVCLLKQTFKSKR
jgi:hypothetical protein